MTEFYIGNTDNNWFDFLKSREPLEDVNFWKPSPQTFKAIEEGQLFLFRLKSPRSVIGGYGVLASSINIPIQLAWDALGERNGCDSLADMINAIRRYRRGHSVTAQTHIGCRVLTNPVFLDEQDWFDVPSDWSTNIVTGKVYNSESDEGAKIIKAIEERTAPSVLFERDRRLFEDNGFAEQPQARYGTPVSIKPRLGQGAFRIKVADAYGMECALSDTRVLPALEAAHIRPYNDGGDHDVANGLFLRRDIHSVLDSGFATISDDMKFHVSSKITEVFNNGNEYKKLHGCRLKLPIVAECHPSIVNIRWHQLERFVGD